MATPKPTTAPQKPPADPIRQQLTRKPEYKFAPTGLPSDPELATLTAQQNVARLNQQEANTQFNAAQAKLMEDRAALLEKKPIDIEALKRQFAQGGVWSNQMGFQANRLAKEYDTAITQGTREITLGQELNKIANKQQQYQNDLTQMKIRSKQRAEQLGVGDLDAGALLSAKELGLIGQDAFDAGMRDLGYDTKASAVLEQITAKQNEITPGLDLPGSVYSAEDIPADHVALAKKFGQQYGVDPNLLLAIARHETNFGTEGLGLQGYTLGYGAYDKGPLQTQYRGVVNQYANAARTLAERGVHDINELQTYQARTGHNVYYATDANWTKKVVAWHNAIVSGQLKVPKPGKSFADSIYHEGQPDEISLRRAEAITPSKQQELRNRQQYSFYEKWAEGYLNSAAEPSTSGYVAYVRYQMKKGGSKDSDIARTLYENAHVFSLALYDATQPFRGHGASGSF